MFNDGLQMEIQAKFRASFWSCIGSFLVAGFVFTHSAVHADTFGNGLAAKFSNRLQEIGNEAAVTRFSLSSLPELPMKDLGGWGIFARIFEVDDHNNHMDVKWPVPEMIDLIALVPSRYFHPAGIDPNYGAPDEFAVHLIDESGVILPSLARESDWRESGVRRGHPFVYQLAKPVLASGLRIQIHRLTDPPLDGKAHKLLSWGEILCFSGDRNVAENSVVTYNFEDPPGDTWNWRRLLLVDGNTPLGLPEKRGEAVTHIGWTSGSHETSDEPVWVQVDLGQEQQINGVRLFPALRPTLDDIPGFGLPVRFRIDVSTTGHEDDFRTVYDQGTKDHDNPGHNPITVRLHSENARFVRLVATRLWKPFARYPAFLALSEFQVFKDEKNLALGATISSSEPTEPVAAHHDMYWSGESLTNGFGPMGKLLGTRQWMEELGERYQLELQLHRLHMEAEEIRSKWTRNTNLSLALFGGSGVIAAFGIPVFFRIRESKRLREMRNWISGDLHDEIGSNLGSIQVLSSFLKQEHPETHEEASTIERVAAETVNSVRDIVWLLRPQTRETAHTIEHLRDTAAILIEPVEWSFRTDISGEDLLLDHEARRNLMLFFREALHNLSRHAKASQVEINLNEIEGMFYLSISDNGVGIPDEIQRLPRFLRALKERAKRLDGRLDIQVGTIQGTTITLIFPQRQTIRTSIENAISRFLKTA